MNSNQTSIEFSSAKYSGLEKDQPFPNQIEITVTRSGNTDNYNTIELHLRRGMTTAQEGIDFDDVFLQPIDFQPGQTEKKVYIDIYDDFELEGTENIELKLIGDLAILGQQDTTTVSILDSETNYLEFESAKYSTFEQEDSYLNKLEVTITRTGDIYSYTSANFEVINITAEEGNDFYIPNLMVDFAPEETSKTIEIEVPDDWNFEGTETFQLQLIDEPYNTSIELGENATTTIEILDKQTTYLEFESAKYSTFEQEDSYLNKLEVTITRTGDIYSYTSANFEVINITAEEGNDFYIPNLMVDFAPEETSKTIEIEVPDDWNFEGTETFQLQLIDEPYNTSIELGENATTTIEILDKQTTYLEFESAKYSTFEQEDTYLNKLEVTITRTGDIYSYTSANFEVINITAEEGNDFYIPNLMVDFAPEETSKTIEIEVPDDWNFEGTETFQLQLIDEPYNTSIELGENATTTIEILDKQTSYLEFESAKYSTFEQEDSYLNKLEVTITRTGDIYSYTSANFEVINITAEEGNDFYIPNLMVDFAPEETSKTIEIEVPDDWNFEGTETFQLQLIDEPYNTSIELGENATTTIEILDKQTSYLEFESAKYSAFENNETIPNQIEVTVNRLGNIDSYLDVEIQSGDSSAQQGLDFDSPFGLPTWLAFSAGESRKTITVNIFDDGEIEGTETIGLQLLQAPYTSDFVIGEQNTTTISIFDDDTSLVEFSQVNYSIIEDDPNNPTNQIELFLTRTGPLNDDVKLELYQIGGSAKIDSDFKIPFEQIEFRQGESNKTVYLDILSDFLTEGTETIELGLRPSPYGNGINNIGEQNTVTINLLDDETTYIEFGAATYTLNEDQGYSIVVEVIRSGDINFDSMVHIEAVGGTAELGMDYHLFNDVYFMSGETSKFVEIDLFNDPEIEGTESIDLQIVPGNGSDNYVIGTQDTTTVDILDSSPTVEFGAATYSVNENEGLSLTVTLTRNGNTSFESFVRLEKVGGTAILGSDYDFNNLIYFAEGETSKAVEIFLDNDLEIEGNETIELQLLSAEGNDNYVIGTQGTTTVEIIDNVVTNTVIAEIGEITDLTHESQTIFLDHNFINPVIFAQPLSYNGSDPSTIRITDIQSNSFSVQVQETTLKDGNFHAGTHTTESFSFLVVEQGIWKLSDDSIIEVGNVATDEITTSNWEIINFNHDFTNTPVVLTQVQTDNDTTFVRTRQRNATNNKFEVALEEEEAFKSSGHSSETIAWLAISPGQGNWDGNEFIAGNTGNQVTHNWHTIDFDSTFINTPKFLGNITTFDGPDSSGLRYRNLTNGNVQIKVEEDTSQDSETNHTTEDINFFAIEAEGNLMGSMDSLIGLVTQETGTLNADSFILGNTIESFYDNYGQQDYAEISDFDVSQDIIQLHGLADDYYLGSSPFETNDKAIFLKVAGMEDELVGIVENTNTLDINSDNFSFV